MQTLQRSLMISYVIALIYTFSFTMNSILVPLYAVYLGHNAFHIGLIVSAQAVLQLIFRLLGGVLADKLGEKVILQYSFFSMALSSMAFVFSSGSFLELFFIQLIVGSSRSVYWSASQSYMSLVNKDHAANNLGRLSSFVNIGMVLGMVAGGMFAATIGYHLSFLMAALLSAMTFIMTFFLPKLQKSDRSMSIQSVMKGFVIAAKQRILFLAGIVAFLSSVTLALQGSIFIIYFKSIDLNESFIGLLNALRPLAGILVGFYFVKLLYNFLEKKLFFISTFFTGIMLICFPLFTSLFMLSILMFLLGLFSGITLVLHQILVAENSYEKHRALSFSVVGAYWSLGHLLIPALFGVLATYFGIAESLFIAGFFLVLISLCSGILFKWLMNHH